MFIISFVWYHKRKVRWLTLPKLFVALFACTSLYASEDEVKRYKAQMFEAIKKQDKDKFDELRRNALFDPFGVYTIGLNQVSSNIGQFGLLQVMNRYGWRYGYATILQAMRRKGFTLNQQDKNNRTILISAAQNGFFSIVKYIFELESDYEKVNIFYQYNRAYGSFKYTALAEAFLWERIATQPYKITGNRGREHKKIILFLAEKMFRDIVANKNKNRLKMLLQGSAVINPNNSQASFLHLLKIVQKDGNQLSPAAWIAAQGWKGGLKELLAFIESIDSPQDNQGRTLLMFAAHAGKLQIIIYLLKQKASLTCRDNKSATALIYATRSPNATLEVIQTLLKDPTTIKILDQENRGPISYVAEGGQVDILNQLLESGKKYLGDELKLNIKSQEGKTPLMYAIIEGHLDITKILIVYGASLDVTDHNRNNALMYAAYYERIDILEHLLTQSPYSEQIAQAKQQKDKSHKNTDTAKIGNLVNPLDRKNKAQQTAMMIATGPKKGYTKVVQTLLNAGASSQVFDINHRNVLMYAAEYGHLDIIDTVAPDLPDEYIEEQSKEGFTALTYAVQANNFKATKKLLEYGANPNTTDYKKYNAFHYAAKEGHYDILFHFLSLTDKNGEPLLEINNKTQDGYTAAMLCAIGGHIKILKELKKANADFEETDELGRNILIHAVLNQREKIVRYILQQKMVNIDEQDKKGKTALIHAAEQGYLTIFKLLYQAGANPNLRDHNKKNNHQGWTALMYAADKEHLGIVRYILLETKIEKKVHSHKVSILSLLNELNIKPAQPLPIIPEEKNPTDERLDNKGKTKLPEQKPMLPEQLNLESTDKGMPENQRLTATQKGLLGLLVAGVPIYFGGRYWYLRAKTISKNEQSKKGKVKAEKSIRLPTNIFSCYLDLIVYPLTLLLPLFPLWLLFPIIDQQYTT